MVNPYATFADIINAGNHDEIITNWLDGINNSCKKHPTNPRDAGVVNPEAFITDPLVLVSIDLEDREIGNMTVRGGGREWTAEFDADDNVGEWVQMDLLMG